MLACTTNRESRLRHSGGRKKLMHELLFQLGRAMASRHFYLNIIFAIKFFCHLRWKGLNGLIVGEHRLRYSWPASSHMMVSAQQ